MISLRTACFALSASALFMGGMLVHSLFTPAVAQAATTAAKGSVTTATAKVQNGEDGLYVLAGDTLLVYRTDAGGRRMELIAAQKINLAGKADAGAAGHRAR